MLLNPFVIKEEILIYFPFFFLFLFLSVWVSWSVQKKRFGFHGVFHVVDLVVECCFFSSKRDARSWWNSTPFCHSFSFMGFFLLLGHGYVYYFL